MDESSDEGEDEETTFKQSAKSNTAQAFEGISHEKDFRNFLASVDREEANSPLLAF